ncbi:MAG: DUF3108 domain-containing protein [Oligoflexia bacterium]|nr:DUF3108 domain-containing protein [Oligoflexia bacterium]
MHKSILILVFFTIGCASKTPNLKEPVDLAPIKEYEDKIKVKEIKTEAAKNKSSLGLEPIIKKELKGKRKKRDETIEGENVDVTRLPEVEDKEGFSGRRPVAEPYRVGEKITLMITYFGVSAGDATLEIKPHVEVNGRRAYHFYSSLKSSAVFSMFYKVDDYCETFMDYEQLVPLNFTLSAKETKQLREVRMFFDWKTLKSNYWEQRVTADEGKQEKKKEWELVPFSQNIYTALQYVRVFKLRDGKTYTYQVSDDGTTWSVKAKVVRREVLKTDLGSFKTVVIEPEVSTKGILKPMGEVLFWFTDDDRKFPIKFESKIKIGKLVGYLKALEPGAP